MKYIIIGLIFALTLILNISAKEKCDRPWKLGDPLVGPCKYDQKTKKLKLPDSKTVSNLGGKAKSAGKKFLDKLNTESTLTDVLFKKD